MIQIFSRNPKVPFGELPPADMNPLQHHSELAVVDSDGYQHRAKLDSNKHQLNSGRQAKFSVWLAGRLNQQRPRNLPYIHRTTCLLQLDNNYNYKAITRGRTDRFSNNLVYRKGVSTNKLN